MTPVLRGDLGRRQRFKNTALGNRPVPAFLNDLGQLVIKR
ncbi:hypothetical protein SPHINGO391_300043 [Sphingomonas aurantiaca]|uniref:Uncharacterized protein n=1 Tax=Sphingomonas aurantiaca TaxID=185949 RepID=A0A5E7XY62_9SPHN|nr:hypothetical protein SPHINGO391_300043 [Sphingomonas aurantiaca]